MKRSIISLLVAGLFAGTAAMAADHDKMDNDKNMDPNRSDVTTDPNGVETSQSRSADPNKREAMNDADTSKYESEFKKADKDNDGTLDRKEARKLSNKNVAKNFDTIDTDKNGTLSWDEVNTYMAAHPKGTKDQM
ncbi:MAG: hypothetical protein ABI619_13495 [Betaproteobacteria bacterium]